MRPGAIDAAVYTVLTPQVCLVGRTIASVAAVAAGVFLAVAAAYAVGLPDAFGFPFEDAWWTRLARRSPRLRRLVRTAYRFVIRFWPVRRVMRAVRAHRRSLRMINTGGAAGPPSPAQVNGQRQERAA